MIHLPIKIGSNFNRTKKNGKQNLLLAARWYVGLHLIAITSRKVFDLQTVLLKCSNYLDGDLSKLVKAELPSNVLFFRTIFDLFHESDNFGHFCAT